MIKKSTRYLTIMVLFISICFCADAGSLKPGKTNTSDKKNRAKAVPSHIISFVIPQQLAPEVIDETNHSIGLVVHAGTPLTALTPTINYVGSTITPNSGVTQDFTGAVGYIVDQGLPTAVFYSVQVLQARAATPICSGLPTTITGDPPPAISGTYKWEILNQATGAWSPAPGPNLITGANYQTPGLASNLNAPKLYTFRRSITTVFGITYDSYNDLTVNPNTSISGNTIPPLSAANSTFCVSGNPGTITGSQPTGGIGPGSYIYRWQSSTAGGPFTDVPGGIGKDLVPGTITATTIYKRFVTSGTCTPPTVSNPVTITIQNALGNNTITAPPIVSFCETGTFVISGSFPSGGDNVNYTYQWQNSTDGTIFNNIPNATSQNLAAQTITQTTWYQRIIVSGGTCNLPSTSLPVKISVTPKITNNTITAPGAPPYCVSGNPGTITGLPATGGDGPGTYTYKWQISTDGGVTYQDAPNINNQKDYTTGVLTQTTSFQRIVSSGACVGSSVSAPVVITVYKALANNTLTPPSPSAFCGSGTPGTIIGSTPTGGDGLNYTYQWESSADNTTFNPITTNGTGKDYTPPSLSITMYYRRIVVKSATCTTPSISGAVEIHITPPITFSSIQSPPFSYCVSVDPETLSGSPPQGGDGGNSYLYQWYSSTDDGVTWVPINGATGIDYDPPTITQTTWFRRDATSGACQVPFPSNIAKIVVNQTPADVSVTPVAPICAGNKVTLSVISPDAALTYIWYDTPTKNSILFTGPSYTTDILTASRTFYVEASNGTCPSPTLTSAPVTVNPLPAAPTLVVNPVSTCQGSTAALNISNPQPGYTYNWYTAGAGGIPISANVTFTTPPVNAAITYYAEAVNSTGCVSATRTQVNVAPIPFAQVRLTGASVCPGDPGTITSDNIDPTIEINWFATPTSTNILYTGNSYTPQSPVTANTTYYAEVAHSCVPAVRASAQIKLIQPLPTPVVSVESTFAPNITFSWAAVTGATGYEVSIDGGQTFTPPSSGSDGTTHTVTGLQIGQSVIIIVRATGGVSCQLSNNSSPVTATAINPLIDQIYVANAFTPNGDGKNDIVYVHNENIKSLKFYVYDQVGELLYISQSQQNGWDGTFKGKTEPAGVYVYYLEAIMNDGKLVKKKGTITLLR